jgi:hypothetical protein
MSTIPGGFSSACEVELHFKESVTGLASETGFMRRRFSMTIEALKIVTPQTPSCS